MRKLFALLIVTVALIGAVFVPVAAAPAADVAQLAAYFPEDTALFAAARTDDDFIATLDTVVGTLAEALPRGSLPVSSARELLNFLSISVDPEGDFDSVFRSWLGDTAVVGILSFETGRGSDPATILAAEITDQAGAEMYLEATGVTEGYTREERDGAVIYTPRLRMGGQPFVIVREDALLISMGADNVEAAGVQSAPLSENAAFIDTLARLPQASYNAVIYNDFVNIFNQMSAAAPLPEEFAALYGALGPQVYGATIVDGRSLTIDVVATYTDLAALEAVSGDMSATSPVDMALADHVMAGTPLVILANNGAGAQPLEQLETVIESFSEQGMMTEQDMRDFRQGLFFIETGIRGITGMEPDDVFGIFAGDVALTLGLSAAASDAADMAALGESLPVEFGLIAVPTDGAMAEALVEGLATNLSDFVAENLTIARDEIGGANALVLTVEASADTPFPIELVIATNGDVIAAGTRRTVEFALAPAAGAGLSSDPAFIEAMATLLPDSIAIAYAAGEGFQPLARVVAADSNSSDGENLGILLSLISSASISSTQVTDNAAFARLVWTLPE